MNFSKFVFYAALAAGFTARALSAEQGAMTWSQAVAVAKAGNPSLQSAWKAVEQADEGVTMADADFWPSLNASAGWSRNGSSALAADGVAGPEADQSTFQGGLQASWKLFEGFAGLYNRAQAVEMLIQKRQAYALVSAGLRQSLRQAFSQLLYDQANQALLANISQRLHKDTRYLELKYKAGQEARWTYLTYQSQEASVNWQMDQNKLNTAADQAALAAVLGLDQAKAGDLKVEGSLEPAPPDELDQAAFEEIAGRHPAVRQAEAAARAADARLGTAIASRYPDLTANGSLGYSGANQLPANQRQWSAGLSLSYNLFAGGSEEASISQARQALQASQDDLAFARASQVSQLRKAWASFRSAAQRLSVMSLSLAAAQERFNTVARLYDAGDDVYLDYEQAENLFTQAQQQQLSADLSATQAQAGFENALGLEIDESGLSAGISEPSNSK